MEGSNVVIALAGNKVDIPSKREVATHEGLKLAKEMGLVFMEISAKTGENVYEIFTKIAQRVPRHVPRNDSVHLNFESYESNRRNLYTFVSIMILKSC